MNVEHRRRYPLYVRQVPRWWWLETAPFRRFVLRELTSVFVAAYSVILLLFLVALSRGREQYEGFLAWLDLPAVAVLHAVILVAVLLHTITSIQLAAEIQEVRLRRKTLSRRTVAAGFTAGWLLTSAFVAYFHLWSSP